MSDLREPHETARVVATDLRELADELFRENRPNVEAVRGRLLGQALAVEGLADRLTEEGPKQAVISEAIDALLHGPGSPTDRGNEALRVLRRGAEGERVR